MDNHDFLKQYQNLMDDELCDKNDIETLSMVLSLKNLMFSKKDIQLFLKCSVCLQKKLLKKQRQILLEKAHDYYKLVDQVDFMLCELNEKKDE